MRSLLAIPLIVLAACGQPQPPSASAPAAPSPAPAIAERPPAIIAERIATLPAPYNAGVYENGRRVFAQCRSCHTVHAGGVNRVGPNLHAMFGKRAATMEGFKTYSAGLKESGIVWDATTMDKWLANPREVVATNNMIFPGLRNEEDRRDVIAYLAVETAASD